MMADRAAQGICLSTFLNRLGGELDLAADHAVEVEEGISALVEAGGAVSREAVRALQRLDHLHQTLVALSGVLSKSAAQQAPGEVTLAVDGILSDVTLRDVAKRLQGHTPETGEERGEMRALNDDEEWIIY
ncbi:hypothetical protein PB2503_07609 [Parvularcula bermudensis HTCC2503]|uniref:Uncharacterized protein n=1 Tax=Parvularcula bermudensis (strain ATCC BAA-594 / HTCC2503 / KCTC 12087) TaxID=314260 RepID=E0TFX8_PARBH|nr:hypothetical protein [Parvularcula bermudensis]ADM09577.1 hypothetical protein PB2503_07609 [Parvularcula bermudensis HTCC2503]